MNDIRFNKRKSIEQIEESNELCPKFDQNGLMPCITIEASSGTILMFSFLNENALKLTIEKKQAHYFSRSRKRIWHKGEVSGLYQIVKNIYIDDDQDCIIYEVELNKPRKGGEKASCHVGYKSCFYRKIEYKNNKISLKFIEKKKVFDPDLVYAGIENPTKI